MDDLEVNPLHRAFLTKFRREFELACKKSYVIAIPKSETLDNYRIDVQFAKAHILIPSKLLRMHYNPLQVGNFEDIEIDNKKLICTRKGTGGTSERKAVRILFEEIGYNVLGKEYKVMLVSEPLASARQQRSMALSLREILAPLSPRSASSAVARKRRAHLIGSRVLLGHDDCVRYLEFISHELTMILENDVKRLQSNYVILPHYLEDAAGRTRRLAESYVRKYEAALASASGGGTFEICDTIRRSLRLALENYVAYLMHGKLLAAIQSNYQAKDKSLGRKFDLVLASRMSICELGAQADFSDFQLNDDLMRLLRRLPSLQSPLAMVSCLVKLVDLINDALNQSVRFKRMLGETTKAKQQRVSSETSTALMPSLSTSKFTTVTLEPEAPIPICSDDLIASFVFCLARAKPCHLFSALKYLELFGWTSVEKNMTAYYLATFESAIEHILHFSKPSNGHENVACGHVPIVDIPYAGSRETVPAEMESQVL